LGLTEALGISSYDLKTLSKPGLPWKLLPAALWPASMALRLPADGVPLQPPWPDLMVTCGRCSVAASVAVRRLSEGRSFTVHIQDPHVGPENFDRVVVAAHDALRGPNVLATPGALHRVTREKIEAAMPAFAETFAALPRPLIAVLVGGGLKGATVAPDAMRDFAEKLRALSLATGGGIALTPSRRTGEGNIAILKSVLSDVPSWIWDGTGENPYFALMGHGDAIVVTSDSVSMTSEACYTGTPVYVHDFGIRSKRIRRFQQGLAQGGVTRPLTGVPQDWTYPPMDSVAMAADFVLPALRAHLARLRGRTAQAG